MPEQSSACPLHKTSVGGQALIEGIMMQGPKGAAVSVRIPDGSIETIMKQPKHIRDKIKPLGWPVLRGCVNFVESMIFGYQCLAADRRFMQRTCRCLFGHARPSFSMVL